MRTTNSRLSACVLAAALGLVVMAGLAFRAGSAMAHAGYESSSPAEDEVITESPETVEIYFTQEMRRTDEFPNIFVVNESGDTVSTASTLSDEDRTLVTVNMPPALPNGRYTVIWHTLSADDGEEAYGAFHFYVGEGPSGGGETPPAGGGETPSPTQPPDTPEPTNDGDDGGVPVWALIAGIIGAAVIAGGAGIVIGRASGG